MAASRTMWQSEQDARCFLISLATGGESLPSKYQQIKWIVSRQLMTADPQRSVPSYRIEVGQVHFRSQTLVLEPGCQMPYLQRLTGSSRQSVEKLRNGSRKVYAAG